MTELTTIYVVRHGESLFNVEGILGGTYEPNPLTKTGKRQADLLAQHLKGIIFDKIYTSDLSRAHKTAMIIGKALHVPIEATSQIRERYWGSLQGKKFIDAKREHFDSFKKEDLVEGEEAFKFRYVEDMESLEETVNRFEIFLNNVLRQDKGKTVLLVCHFDIMVGYLVKLGVGTYQGLMNAHFEHTGYYRLIGSSQGLVVDKIVGLTHRN